MKRDKILTFGFAALFAAGLLSSCSQEDVAAGVDLHRENNKTVTVKELTERTKVYNANVYGVTRASQEPWMPNPELSTDLKMKIVVADVKGGIRGYRHGGWLGGLVGAAVSSLVKAVTDRLFGSKRVELSNPTVFIAGVAPAFSDSIGYYHNHLEGMMYNMDNNSNLLTSASLLSRADSIMLDTSTGYAAADRLNGMQKAAIAADADVVRSIDSSDMTFDEYCGKLTSLNRGCRLYRLCGRVSVCCQLCQCGYCRIHGGGDVYDKQCQCRRGRCIVAQQQCAGGVRKFGGGKW